MSSAATCSRICTPDGGAPARASSATTAVSRRWKALNSEKSRLITSAKRPKPVAASMPVTTRVATPVASIPATEKDSIEPTEKNSVVPNEPGWGLSPSWSPLKIRA